MVAAGEEDRDAENEEHENVDRQDGDDEQFRSQEKLRREQRRDEGQHEGEDGDEEADEQFEAAAGVFERLAADAGVGPQPAADMGAAPEAENCQGDDVEQGRVETDPQHRQDARPVLDRKAGVLRPRRGEFLIVHDAPRYLPKCYNWKSSLVKRE